MDVEDDHDVRGWSEKLKLHILQEWVRDRVNICTFFVYETTMLWVYTLDFLGVTDGLHQVGFRADYVTNEWFKISSATALLVVHVLFSFSLTSAVKKITRLIFIQRTNFLSN